MRGRRKSWVSICALAAAAMEARADWTNICMGPVGSGESLEWTIPGFDTWGPVAGRCTLSELRWSYSTVGAKVSLDWLPKEETWVARASGQAGWIVGGSATDRDWHGPNRSLEVSSTISKVSGWSGQMRVMGGRCWSWDKFAIAPLVGAEVHHVYLRENGLLKLFEADFTEIKSENCAETGIVLFLEGKMEICPVAWWCHPREDLVSTYQGTWSGPLLGFSIWAYPPWRWDVTTSPMSWELTAWLGLERWDADADWCLRQEYAHPRSFSHHAEGIVLGVEDTIRFEVNDRWSVVLQTGGQIASFPSGEERLYWSDGDASRYWVDDTLWKQWWGSVGVSMSF